jgi:TIR domain
MLDSSSARIFISYSRQEGAVFASDLRNRLLEEGLSVWQDLTDTKGGRDVSGPSRDQTYNAGTDWPVLG